VTGHRLILEQQQDAATELRRLGVKAPRARSLLDELLAERRLESDAE
jgi:antitoxin PrlF